MANEQEIAKAIKAAKQEKILEECRYSSAFADYINTANEILCALSNFNPEEGLEIKEVAQSAGLNFNTACIYLRQLEKAGMLTSHKLAHNKEKIFLGRN